MYDAYTIAASALKYVFLVIIAFVLLRLFVLSLREWRAGAGQKRKLRNSLIGTVVVLSPAEMAGDSFILCRETIVGKSRACDISVPLKSLRGKHAIIFERKGELYILSLYPKYNEVYVNRSPIGRSERILGDGYIIQMEQLTLKVRLADAWEEYNSEAETFTPFVNNFDDAFDNEEDRGVFDDEDDDLFN